MQTAIRLSEGDIKVLDGKCTSLGISRTEFLRILIRTGCITSSYTVEGKGEQKEGVCITESYTKEDTGGKVFNQRTKKWETPKEKNYLSFT